MLQRIQLSLAAIRNRLLQDEMIRKLLFHDSNNALNMTAPNSREVEKYITLRPIYDFENKSEYDQNSAISVFMTEASPIEGENVALQSIVQINVVSNLDTWDLVDMKIRPIELCDKIIALLDGVKFNVSHKLEWTHMTDLVINKNISGYALLFMVLDGSGETNNY